jgi:glycosyltransferase involved in cell wall biosynthesis
MLHRPKVSICIPSYNHARFLPAAIESALAQTFRDFEIVIVDDGSTDGSLSVAEDYAARFPSLIRVLTHPGHRNMGIAKTSNLAMRSARGEFWSGLPSDDVLFPEKLEVQVAYLEAHPELGWVYGNAEFIDEEGVRQPQRGLFGEDLSQSENPVLELIERNVIPAMTILVRRELLERPGGEDESLLYSDWDAWVRLMSISKFAFLDRPLVAYRIHDQNTSLEVEPLVNMSRTLEVMRALRGKAANVGHALALPRTQALLDLQLTYAYFCLGQTDKAEQSLASAFQVDPSLGRDENFFSAWLRRRAFDKSYYFPLGSPQRGFSSWLVQRLGSSVTRKLRHQAEAIDFARRAFENRQVNKTESRRMALACLARDPAWLKDKSFCSLLADSTVGINIMNRLRILLRKAGK